MDRININVNVVAYADQDRTANPLIKFADFRWSLLGLPADNPKNVPIDLAPGETRIVMSNERTLSFTGSTVFTVAQVGSGPRAQIQGSFGSRTGRSDGDATTQWALTKQNTLMKATYTGTGTSPSFGSMSAGDGVTFGPSFNVSNQGDFTVVKVGAGFIEFVNAIGVAETVTAQLDVYSSGPVQVGDFLDITSSQFTQPNQGAFQVLRVTDTFIEFSNSSAVPEAITGVTSGFTVYPESFKWMLAGVDQKIVIRMNGDTGSGVEIEPTDPGDLVNSPGLFLKRGKVFRVEMMNPGLVQAKGFLFLAE